MQKIIISGILTLSLFSSVTAQAKPFPTTSGTDTTYSLGTFGIKVDSSIVNSQLFTDSNTGILKILTNDGFKWNSKNDILTSPLLFDNNTQIHHDAPTIVGSGSNPNTVKTQIVQFNMHTDDNKVQLRAGSSALNAAGESTGLVKSIDMNAGGFPAKSSFNVYVEADIYGLAGYLYNPLESPLKIFNNSISDFPPTVAYTHNRSSTTLIDYYDPTTKQSITFGEIVLAGHSVKPIFNAPHENKPYETLDSFQKDPSYSDVANNLAAAVPELEEWILLLIGLPLIASAVKKDRRMVL